MKTLITLFAGFILPITALADSPSPAAKSKPAAAPPGEIALREVRYDGKLSDDEARFVLDVDAEVTGKGD